MSEQPSTPFGTKLVGNMLSGEKPEFISLTLNTDGAGWLDRPNSFRFHQAIHDAHVGPIALQFRADSFWFVGALKNGRYVGALKGEHSNGTHGASGTFELLPVYDLQARGYQRSLGHYRLATGRTIRLNRDSRPQESLYFYESGDRVVRLYLIDDGTFLSERLETLTLGLSAEGAVSSMRLREYSGTESRIERIEWCREEQVRISVNDYELAGTLILPPGEGKHPLVILCHLADTHERDYYRLFAEPFVERGIAAFIYDKRGSGESTGEALFSQIYPLADDATAAFQFLQQHPAILSDRIGMWGISNGAWVAVLTASRVGDTAFVIGVSGSGVSPARQEQLRRTNVARSLGASPRAVGLIERFWEVLFKFYVDGRWSEELGSLLQQVYDDEELQRLPKHPDHAPDLQPVPPSRPIEAIRTEGAGAWAEGGFEVADSYARLRCPILCLWGERDNVLPVQESLERIEQALQRSHHPDYTMRVIPQATHQLYLDAPPVVGVLSEVMHAHLHNVMFAPGVRQMMAGWTADRVL